MQTNSASSTVIHRLSGEWLMCSQPASRIVDPRQLESARCDWHRAPVPGTVASALAASGEWKPGDQLHADAFDWWYRTTFDDLRESSDQVCHLCFDGLATLAEVWLNGRIALKSDNMYRSYRLDVTELVERTNELVLVFRSLANALLAKRPRPRWKTNLVSHQQLRWYRTSLLGRIPGWSPPVEPVGPWREVRLECGNAIVSSVKLDSRLEGMAGVVTCRAQIHSRQRIERSVFRVGDCVGSVEERRTPEGATVEAVVTIPDAQLWWPHTHGKQPLFDCTFGFQCNGDGAEAAFERVGFRTVEKEPGTRFGLRINGQPIYCRGACWTADNIATLDGSVESLKQDLTLARNAGANMLRVGGTMFYPTSDFYRACSELGILVWQDFMYANMDYPVDDRDFAANIEAEATEQIARLAPHPCVAVYCGNSEVEQQAAMVGIPESIWRSSWFGERLPKLCAEGHPGTVYVPSTPTGGALPFHVREGVAHYYGVGAYLRSVADLRKDDVGFTSECLGFANVPEQSLLEALGDGVAPPVHHPRWKERVPRDNGTGWDFDDVRDHYLKTLFGVDPVRLRSFDPERYLQLSRIVPGELMSQVFSEWRAPTSSNRGGLVWYFKDLWPGAGWGIVDSEGTPKACYYALQRVWQPLQITVTNEGLDGLHLHAINETEHDFDGTVELALLKDDRTIVARNDVPCMIPARSACTMSADAILGSFHDLTYSYRFGPPQFQAAGVALLDRGSQIVSETHFFPCAGEPALLGTPGLSAEATEEAGGTFDVQLQSDHLLRFVSFDVDGFLPDDNYFHLWPLRAKRVRLTPRGTTPRRLKGYVGAINLKEPIRIVVKEPGR